MFFCRSRDALRCGYNNSKDKQLYYPDYQATYGSYAIVLGEFKTLVASRRQMDQDFLKLVAMAKMAIDRLFQNGFPGRVVFNPWAWHEHGLVRVAPPE